MDALDLLKEDHQRVKELFEQISDTTGRQGERRIFENIRGELETHMHVEETVFYPAFRKYDEFKGILEKSYREHQQVKDLLAQIRNVRDESEFRSKLEELKNSVEHHVQEEENDLFPRVRDIMKRPEREQLGRHLQAAKDERLESAA